MRLKVYKWKRPKKKTKKKPLDQRDPNTFLKECIVYDTELLTFWNLFRVQLILRIRYNSWLGIANLRDFALAGLLANGKQN